MAGDVTVRVVFDHFPQIIAAMNARADTVVQTTTMNLEAQMKVRWPVRTGFLRASTQGSRVAPRKGRVVVGAEYGALVNYGARGRAPVMAVENAVAVVRPAFLAAMRKVVA